MGRSDFAPETGRWPAQVDKLTPKPGHIDSKYVDIQFMIEIKKRGNISRSYDSISGRCESQHVEKMYRMYPAQNNIGFLFRTNITLALKRGDKADG